METLGSLIEIYEGRNIPKIEGNPIDALKALMVEHGLKQSDLSEIGRQGVISEILSGKRQLNIRQIQILSKRFNFLQQYLYELYVAVTGKLKQRRRLGFFSGIIFEIFFKYIQVLTISMIMFTWILTIW